MILGFHLVISCYGHWLPNDPRGSGSRYVGSQNLYATGGKATKVESRRSVAHEPHDVCLRMKTKEALQYPPIVFSEQQTVIVGTACGVLLHENKIAAFACTVAPDHVHLLIGPTDIHIDEVVLLLKETAAVALVQNDQHPRSLLAEYDKPLTVAASVWARGSWKVFIDNVYQMHATIRYIENHRHAQRWKFVVPYI